MYNFEQTFIIQSIKPIIHESDYIYSLTVKVNTLIDTPVPLDETEDLWGLFLDKDYRPNAWRPLLLVPIPGTQLEWLTRQAREEKKFIFTYYKDVKSSSSMNSSHSIYDCEFETLTIDKKEFYSILDNDLHFIHEKNLPCVQLRE